MKVSNDVAINLAIVDSALPRYDPSSEVGRTCVISTWTLRWVELGDSC